MRHLGRNRVLQNSQRRKASGFALRSTLRHSSEQKRAFLTFGPKASFAMVAVPKDESPFTGFLIFLPPCATSHWWL